MPEQIKALMVKHRIWIEHSTLIEDDLPARELRAVQAEQHQFDAFVMELIALAVAQGASGETGWKSQTASALPTVELFGVKDGLETSLGEVPMPPTMKARELLRDQGFTDIDDEMSLDACALWACESLIEYCQAYYTQEANAE